MAGSNKLTKTLIIGLVLVLAALGGVFLYFAEGEEPGISISPLQEYINGQARVKVLCKDEKSGLSSVQVQLKQGNATISVVDKVFPAAEKQWSYDFSLPANKLQQGKVQIIVRARDRSWKDFFQGNLSRLDSDYILDTQVPRVYLQSFAHNLRPGGSGLISFNATETLGMAGVKVGQYYFPAYAQEDSRFLCLFSYPYRLKPGDKQPLISAVDRAGNENRIDFNYYVAKSKFSHSRMKLSSSFLQRKMPEFKEYFPEKDNLLDIFLAVNRELRQKNRKMLVEIGKQTASRFLWKGRFLRLPRAARMSSFGVKRSYFYQGQKVDEQTHLGIDLASVARAKVPAANSGKVVYVGEMGIYGRTVIIDHGLGLQTLYGHLSQIAVQEKQPVNKGDYIGRTGATGMAGGDHLHYAVLVSGIPVNPEEWWDEQWIENNILQKLSGQE